MKAVLHQLTVYRLPQDDENVACSKAAESLANGNIVIIPTDTVYGVAADPYQPDAIERIYQAKKRDGRKPIPFLASGIEAVEKSGVKMNRYEMALAEAFWPGGLTLILELNSEVKEGFRVPDNAIARNLLNMCGGLLRVTSANISGEPDAQTADIAIEAIGQDVDVVIDAGPCPIGKPSTVVRVQKDKLVILRSGAIPVEQLENVMKSVKPKRIIFVCTGNVCRSPMAEYFLKRELGSDTDWDIISTGMAAGRGMDASEYATDAMREKGIDISGHRSRILTKELVEDSAIIVVMTSEHKAHIEELFPESQGKVYLLRYFDKTTDVMDIDDPMGSTYEDYKKTRDEIESAIHGLKHFLLRINT